MSEPTIIITSVADLLAAYARGERDFAGRVRLPWGANLGGANLGGADLAGADLAGADLWSANLTGAHLWGANLTGADLTSANLTGANLTGANLTGADLTSANLTSANLTSANLVRADLEGAKNLPSDSHDLLAELLRRAAGKDVARRAFAGLLLVSRDWCWEDYQRMREAGTWPAEIVAWAGETLGAYDSLAPFLRRYGWLPPAAAEGGAR